jgi:hypothetical protein
MRLLTLLLFILFAIAAFLLFCKGGFTEMLTPSPYVISWEAPGYSGGDSSCCSYEWQICSDENCTTIVDSGKVAKGEPLTASTTKLDWQNTYYVWTRAINSVEPGEWTKLTFQTGDGVIENVVIAEEVTASANGVGVVGFPLTIASKKITIWSKLSGGANKTPNTYVGTAFVTINRLVGAGPTRTPVDKFSVALPWISQDGPDNTKLNIFLGSSPIEGLQVDDLINVDIYISQPGVPPEVSESITTFVVVPVAPGSVTSLKVNYDPPPASAFPPMWSSIPSQLKSQNPAGSSVSGVTRDKCQQLCADNPDCKFFWYDSVLNKCDQQAIAAAPGGQPLLTAAFITSNDSGDFIVLPNSTFAPMVPDSATLEADYVACSNKMLNCTGVNCRGGLCPGVDCEVQSGWFQTGISTGKNCFSIKSQSPSNVRTYVKPKPS